MRIGDLSYWKFGPLAYRRVGVVWELLICGHGIHGIGRRIGVV